MPDVVMPFTRKHNTQSKVVETSPRHRRDGHFDDNDQWHDEPDSRLTANG
jgi:hypothetical protein